MTFPAAIRRCFSRYATFSGRASRSEYWWFFLFLVLGNVVCGLLDGVLFGTGSIETASGRVEAQAGGGILSAVFGLVTIVPALAAGWRRMHDSGRSGLYLFYPLIVIVGISSFAALTGAYGAVAQGTVGLVTTFVLIMAGLVFMLSPFVVIWWLARPSQPEANRFGPPPAEAPA